MKIKEKLLLKYLNGTCSKKQAAKVQAWLAEDSSHSLELERLQTVWSELDALKSYKYPNLKQDWKVIQGLINVHGVKENPDIVKPSRPTSPPIGSSVTLNPKPIVNKPDPIASKPDPKTNFESTKSLESKSIPPKVAPPIINPQPSNITNTPASTYVPETKVETGLPMTEKVLFTIAALLAAGIIAWGIYALTKKKDPLVEIASADVVKEVVLPDGSEVLLDPFSRLIYPREMAENRRVSLFGSAEFDVVADTEPMIVDYDEVSVLTRGTAFDLKNEDEFVTVECHDGRIRFFETINIDNGVEVSEGEKYKYADGIFESMSAPIEEVEEIEDSSEESGEVVRLDRLLDWLMEESDWKVTSAPSMPIDRDHEVAINLDQSYDNVLASLKEKIDIEYRSAACSGCYLITKMKALQ